MRQIVLDTETTGLKVEDGHRIIEIAAVELINRKLTGQYFHQYICPRRQIDSAALAVHGITEEFLADKPIFEEIVDPLLAFIEGGELIIHNALFDVTFLNHELQRVNKSFKSVSDYCVVLDTLLLARKKHPGQQNNLNALCKRYGIDNSERQLHGALLDAHLLSSVYLAMTGGQISLFDDNSLSASDITTSQSNKVSTTHLSKQVLKIIHPDVAEMHAHLDCLEKIKQASGGVCLWFED